MEKTSIKRGNENEVLPKNILMIGLTGVENRNFKKIIKISREHLLKLKLQDSLKLDMLEEMLNK